MKICNICLENKKFDEYKSHQSRGKIYRDNRCISCIRRLAKIAYDKDPEKFRRRSRESAKRANKEKKIEIAKRHRINQLKNLYGIAEEKAKQIALEVQICEACGEAEDPNKRKFALDHCHQSGKFRGILCHPCNTALGLLKDNPDRIQSLLRHIQEKYDEDN